MKVTQSTSQPIQNKPATSAEAGAATAAKRTEKSEAAKEVATRKVDSGATKAEISPKAREFAKAKEVANSAPDVREDRIAELKARIAGGKYEVNAKAIADKMVDEHLASGIG